MTPEEKARIQIDQMLEAAGWKVVNRDEITVGMQALAVREGLLEGNLEADYLLFVGNRAASLSVWQTMHHLLLRTGLSTR